MDTAFIDTIKKEFNLNEKINDNFAYNMFKKYEQSGLEKIKKMKDLYAEYNRNIKESYFIKANIELIEELLSGFKKNKLDLLLHSYFHEETNKIEEKILLEEVKENNLINNVIKRNIDFKVSKKEKNVTENINNINNILESLKNLDLLRESSSNFDSDVTSLLGKLFDYSSSLYENRKQRAADVSKEMSMNIYERKIYQKDDDEEEWKQIIKEVVDKK